MPRIVRATLDAEVVHTQPEPDVSTLIGSRNSEKRDWRTEAMQADLMPGGGEAHQRTSEFQARRAKQIEVPQGAREDLFGKELTRESLRDMLNLTDNFAEEWARRDGGGPGAGHPEPAWLHRQDAGEQAR